MQFLTEPNIDFMKYRRFFVIVSLALLVAGVVEILFLTGLNLGIDFAGGTQLTVKFRESVEIDRLRDVLQMAGQRDTQLQRIGADEENEVLLKAPIAGESEEGSSDALIAALHEGLGEGEMSLDLNQRGVETLTQALYQADPDGVRSSGDDLDAMNEGRTHYEAMAESILERRRVAGILASWDDVRTEAVSPAAGDWLEQNAQLGMFSILQNENVGPQIGSELRTKGILAVTLSLLGMLAYIWFRFELRFGVGALVAIVHDFTITLGLYAMFGYEFNLPTIAAFLTLVGYSVNDTVVIFDRVRENMRRYRRKDLVEILNLSINQTLSRTVLTSGTTLLVVSCLFFLGGEVIRGFAFVLLIGVVIGTYSSLYVASPFVLVWEKLTGGSVKKPKSSQA